MKGKLFAFSLAVFGIATIGISQLTVKAAVDNTRDCDQFAIIWCGTQTTSELHAEYDSNGKSNDNTSTKENADIKKVFSAMGINRSEMTGLVAGTVYQDGRVVVGGKTVATGAIMAARGLGGSPIAGTNASKVSVGKMSSAQTALVKMNGDKFVFAIMKPCGNPVTATPTPQPNPKASCKNLTQEKISDTRYRYRATAEISGGAKVKSYVFVATKDGKQVDSKTVTTDNLNAAYALTTSGPGKYSVSVSVNTSEGKKSGPDCVKSFEIKQPPTPNQPGVTVEKYVDTDKKYLRVGVNVEYSYRIVVRNTGNTPLKNVKVTDTADEGITLTSVTPPNGTISDGKIWTYTIPTLMKGESQTYTLKAKVPVFLAGKLTNTVCVDAPEVPGTPDECDEADVDVPPAGKTQVCNPATGEIIEVEEAEASKYVPVGSPECEETPEPPVEETPEALPETGPTETILSVIGAMSLVGSGAYYLASRRIS